MSSEQQVRERAYFIWRKAGGGSAEAHWLQAEAEVREAQPREAIVEAPLAVRPPAEAVSLAPSPAKTLPKRPSHTKAAAKSSPGLDGSAKSPKPKAARGQGAALH